MVVVVVVVVVAVVVAVSPHHPACLRVLANISRLNAFFARLDEDIDARW